MTENIPQDPSVHVYENLPYEEMEKYYAVSNTETTVATGTTDGYEYWNDPAYAAYYKQYYPEYYTNYQGQTMNPAEPDVPAPGTIPTSSSGTNKTAPLNSSSSQSNSGSQITSSQIITTSSSSNIQQQEQNEDVVAVPYPEGYVPSKASLASQKLLAKFNSSSMTPASQPTPATNSSSVSSSSYFQQQQLDSKSFDTSKSTTASNIISTTQKNETTGNTGGGQGDQNKPRSKKRILRSAGGEVWEDETLAEWDPNDFRIFCGDLGNEVTDDILFRAFSVYPSFQKSKVIRDKKTSKSKGFGFVSFKDPDDFVRAMREMNGKYIGHRPVKLRKSTWNERSIRKKDVKRLKAEGAAINLKQQKPKDSMPTEKDDTPITNSN